MAGKTGATNNRVYLEKVQDALSIENGAKSHLPQHCKECDCVSKPDLDKRKITERSRDATAREVTEAFFLNTEGPMCVSVPSLPIYDKKVLFYNLFSDVCALRLWCTLFPFIFFSACPSYIRLYISRQTQLSVAPVPSATVLVSFALSPPIRDAPTSPTRFIEVHASLTIRNLQKLKLYLSKQTWGCPFSSCRAHIGLIGDGRLHNIYNFTVSYAFIKRK